MKVKIKVYKTFEYEIEADNIQSAKAAFDESDCEPIEISTDEIEFEESKL